MAKETKLEGRMNFLQAKPLLVKNNMDELIDPLLVGCYTREQMEFMIVVASLCIHQSSANRPEMNEACLSNPVAADSIYIYISLTYKHYWELHDSICLGCKNSRGWRGKPEGCKDEAAPDSWKDVLRRAPLCRWVQHNQLPQWLGSVYAGGNGTKRQRQWMSRRG